MVGFFIKGRLGAASLFLMLLFSVCTAEVYLVSSQSAPIPPAAVWDVLVDSRGRLWLGTGKGVVLFDGKGFKIFNSKNTDGAIAKDSVVKVFEDSEGCIWVATRSSFIGGGGISKLCNGRWSRFKGDLPSKFVWDMAEDREGSIWLATDKGAVEITPDGKVKVYDPRTTALGLPGYSVWDLFVDQKGNLWFATDKGIGWFNHREWRNLTTRNSPLKNANASSVFVDSSGRLWIGLRSVYFSKGGVVLYDGKGFRFFHKEHGLPHEDVNTIYQDSEGRIWVGTRGGLAIFRGEGFKTVISNFKVWDIEESDSSLYIATSRGLLILEKGEPSGIARWGVRYGNH